jgi:hypothetical protein
MVTLEAARRLLAFLYPVADVADCWTRLRRHRVVDIHGVMPAAIIPDPATFGSWTRTDLRRHGAHLIQESVVTKYAFKARRALSLLADWVSAWKGH